MGWLRGLGRVLGGCLLVGLLVPSLAVLPTAWIDRGADGSARLSIFPVALTLFDPFVWICVRNSVLVASVVAAGSLMIGVGLASVAGCQRFWGRLPLWWLAMMPLAAGPLLTASGVLQILSGQDRWDWLAARSIAGLSGEDLVRWAALVWVGLASGVPLVALSMVVALRRLEPSWADSARAVGASRWRIWHDIAWPILRPQAARASAAVFTLALAEPAGPLVLGLRRTLAVQMIQAASRLDQPTRAASLALLAVAVAVVVRVAIGWWGGMVELEEDEPTSFPSTSMSIRQATLARLLLMVWSLFAVGPVAWLLVRLTQLGRGVTTGPWFSSILSWVGDPEARGWALNSATTAGLAVALDLMIVASLLQRKSGPGRWLVRSVARFWEAVPPLALGVGALATPWLIAVLADATPGSTGRGLRWVALEMSPSRSPGLLLILALAIGKLPMLARVTELSRKQIHPVRVDAARLTGVSDRRALSAGESIWFGGVPSLPLVLAFFLAATNVTPALLLTPFSERRTLGPAVLGLVQETDLLDPRGLGLIVITLGCNALAFALASNSRVGPLGDWFREA